MQVFVPSISLKESVQCLDNSRLGNQVWREGRTLILGKWPNHPAAKAWEFYKPCLAKYCIFGLIEMYVNRGTIPKHIFDEHYKFFVSYIPSNNPVQATVRYPYWWSYEAIHSSHREALLYKDYEWYSQFGWSEKPAIPYPSGQIPYIWPN